MEKDEDPGAGRCKKYSKRSGGTLCCPGKGKWFSIRSGYRLAEGI